MSSSRREFLKNSLRTSALYSMVPYSHSLWTPASFTAARSNSETENVLVVVQLAGGNDGLNTVVPYGDDRYARNRSTLRLTSRSIRKIDDYLGFHPEMDSMCQLYREGLVSIVQGVGYPDSPRSHPIAMQNWHTSCPGKINPQRGWLGKAIDTQQNTSGSEASGAFIGGIEPPFILNAGTAVVPSLRTLDQLVFSGEKAGRISCQTISDLAGISRYSEDSLIEFLWHETAKACGVSRRIENTIETDSNSAQYPDFQLARNLRTIARLIRAETGFSIYVTELGGAPPGGFDTHANQRDNHSALLRQLSDSISAFSRDLQSDHLLDRVVLATYSEFGRTLAENGRGGTGHGAAAPVLLLGGRAKGGLIGAHPSLDDLDEGALGFQIDFRSLHATLLDKWLKLDSKSILGQEFTHLSLFEET